MKVSCGSARGGLFAGLALVASLIVAAAALAACGAESSEGGSSTSTDSKTKPPPPELTNYLPADSTSLRSADLKAAADELDLPAKANPLKLPKRMPDLTDPRTQLSLVTATAFGPYARAVEVRRPNPILEALDGWAITAAATNEPDAREPVSVIRTSQPFGEIAASLERAGFKRGGHALSGPAGAGIYTSVSSAGRGVVVFAGRKADAGKLASARPGGPARLEALLGPADQPVQFAVSDPDGDCIEAFGGWNNTEGTGVMRFAIGKRANTDALDREVLESGSLTPGTPKATGMKIEIPFIKKGVKPLSQASPLQSLLPDMRSGRIYNCSFRPEPEE